MTPRVHAEWARRVAAEYRSAGVAAQVLSWGVAAGVPVALLRVAGRIVNDELDHAELGHRCLVALGGAQEPVDLSLDLLRVVATDDLLADLVRAVLRDFCLGETLAVPLFAEMRRRADQPAVVPVLDRILADEAVHRAFGWEVLDALIVIDPAVVGFATMQLPTLLGGFAGYADPPGAAPLTDLERGCGLLDNAEYGRIFARTWEEELGPRFARRGIVARL